MSEDLHHIDDLFRQGIEGKDETPSPAVWENIEKELDKKDSRPRFLYWWNTRRIAAAVLILATSAGLFAGGYYFGVKKENKQESTKEKTATPPVSSSATTGNQVVEDKPLINKNLPEVNPEGANTRELAPQTNSDAPNAKPMNGKEKDAVQKNTNALPHTEAKTTNPGGVTRSASKPLTESDKYRPIAATERSYSKLSGTPADPVQNTTAFRIWETETVALGSLSGRSPETQKYIPANKTIANHIPLAASAQASGSSSKKSIPVLNKRSASVDLPRFSLTPVAALQFGSNKIVATNDPHAYNVKTDIDRTESQPLSISGGLLADLKISRNMTIQSGIVFTSRTIEIEPKYIKAERNPDGKVRYKLDCSAGTYYIKKSTYARPGDSALTIFSTNELNYINIPLGLTFHFGGKKFSFFASAGAGLNLLTDQYLETGLSNYSYDSKESIATNLKSRYFNGMIGAGLTYRPFKKVSFLFNPQYQFALTPMNENMPVKAYPRIFNMQMGMQIRL
jgi:hypothetical protein